MRTDTFVRLIVVALMVFFLSACEASVNNPASPDPAITDPAINAFVIAGDDRYVWLVPEGIIVAEGSNHVSVPANCLKVELLAVNPGIGGTVSSVVGTKVYLKWRFSVCSAAPNPVDGKGYRFDAGITNMGSTDLLTSFAGGSYGPVLPGETKEFETRPIVSNSGIPEVMPAYSLAITAKGGWLSFPDNFDHPKEWFALNWKRG